MFTKLRPFVRDFLKQASSLFELYIYTMGEQCYAMEMARLLDPDNAYFNSRHVWQQHNENLILMDRYHYFSASLRSFGLNNSESDGALTIILQVLKHIHQLFFDSECHDDLMGRDVRHGSRRSSKWMQISFQRCLANWRKKAENQKLWRVAEELGAICCEELIHLSRMLFQMMWGQRNLARQKNIKNSWFTLDGSRRPISYGNANLNELFAANNEIHCIQDNLVIKNIKLASVQLPVTFASS
ncbi:hypothetical protein MKX03_003785 [Papaver bracteatum]|nr:hypothetical protein MKX03_003785 [Papaver bracteatum]